MKNAKQERRTLKVSTGYELYPSDLDGTLKYAIIKLTKLAAEYGEDAVLDYGDNCTYGDSPSTFGLYKYAPETDQQYEHRMATDKIRADELLAFQEAEYARLKNLLKKD